MSPFSEGQVEKGKPGNLRVVLGCLISFAVLCLGCGGFLLGAGSRQQKRDQQYIERVLVPILEREMIEHPVLFARQRIWMLLRGEREHRTAFIPHETGDHIAGTAWSAMGYDLVGVNVSYWRKARRNSSREAFADEFVSMMVHEQLHIELGHTRSSMDALQVEAEAWFVETEQLFRPAYCAGRYRHLVQEDTVYGALTAYANASGNARHEQWMGFAAAVTPVPSLKEIIISPLPYGVPLVQCR